MSEADAESYKQLWMKKKAEKREYLSDKTDEVDGDVQMQENGSPKRSEMSPGDNMDEPSAEIPIEQAVKDFWVQSLTELYERTSEQLTIRQQFEDCIKRPYFHVKPLDNIQLQAWWKYLDAVCSKGDHREIVILFERCLVACASYPEFWMRYVLYIEPIDALEATNVMQRAVQVFCRNKSEMHLFAAHFYERRGDVQNARSAYEDVTSRLAPSLLTGILQHAAFEYRQDASEAANALYESKIQTELETADSEIIGFLATQYGYIQFRRFGAKEKARDVVDQVLAKRPDLLGVWEGAIQLEELIQDDASVQRVIALYQRCISLKEHDEGKTLELQDRCTMSARLLNFLDFHGEVHTHGEMHRQHLELFGMCTIAPSLHRKRTETAEADNATGKAAQSESTMSAADTKTTPAVTSTAMSEYLAQNPAAQQYAQYYQYAAAAAAAAGYGSYPGYNASSSSYST